MRAILFGFLFIVSASFPAIAVEMGDDGLHKPDWFSLTFKDVREDLQAAQEDDKRLALIFEQRGCIYCREIHENVLTDPEVRAYLEENFMIVQYNLYGSEEVTDLDGETLEERQAAAKWGVRFTPTVIFLAETAPENSTVDEVEVARIPGAFRKGTFLDMFTWVREKGYETDEGFQAYHSRRIREREAAGIENTD